MSSEFFNKFKIPVLILLGGVLLISLGILFVKGKDLFSDTKVEILSTQDSGTPKIITVEIAGEVEEAGVYKLTDGSRVEDLLIASGGLTKDADNEWVDKYLNRASKLTDGQKVYIPKAGEQTKDSSAKNNQLDQNTSSAVLGQNTTLVNINTAGSSELDKLSGIGPTYAQKIIEQRPYSTIEELVSKKVISKSLFEKIKDSITIY